MKLLDLCIFWFYSTRSTCITTDPLTISNTLRTRWYPWRESLISGANALVVGRALFDMEGVGSKRDCIEAMTLKGQPTFFASESKSEPFATTTSSGEEDTRSERRSNITGP